MWVVTGAGGFLGTTVVRRLLLVPTGIARAVAPFTEGFSRVTGSPPMLTPYSLYTLHAPSRFSHDRAALELGFHPRPLDETIADIEASIVASSR